MGSVIILGATSDISMCLAAEYARHGFRIILAARNPVKLDVVKKDLEIRYNAEVMCRQFDAADFRNHASLISSLGQVDEAVCVFGYLGSQSIAETDLDEMSNIIDINYKGAVSILNQTARHFQAHHGKIIIGVSSVAGERGRQSNYIYGSAKAGFTVYLQGLRNRLYPSKIRVITIKPGFVDTKMTFGLKLPKVLTVSPEYCAHRIFKARTGRSDVVYILWIWRWIMLVIKLIPEWIFKRLKL